MMLRFTVRTSAIALALIYFAGIGFALMPDYQAGVRWVLIAYVGCLIALATVAEGNRK